MSHHHLFAGASFAVVSVVLSLAVATLVLVRIPQDYFVAEERPPFARLPRPLRTLAILGKNLLGLAVIVAGILMSLPGVPGQGVLTMLLGLMLLDVPGRRRLERRIIAHPRVRHGIDRLRARFHRPPLLTGLPDIPTHGSP
jgi:hypothetical protein